MKLIVAILLLIAAVCSHKISYEGYKVFSVIPNKEQLSILHDLDESGKYDFWSPVRKDCSVVDIMVAPEDQLEFISWLNLNTFKWTIKISNVQKSINEENDQQKASSRLKNRRISFDQYYSYDEINDYLDELGTRFGDIVTIDNYGKSSEGRLLKAIRISKGGNNNRKTIFIDAGIHAREWIGPALALYIIDQLLENPDNGYMTEDVNWIIIPLVNPDGYEYTKTGRMWRKTRSSYGSQTCVGVDANRNYAYHWNDGGTSNDPCSAIYHGPNAFSEPEANLLANYAKEHAHKIKFYLTSHSYGQLILYPWSFKDGLPEDHALLNKVGEIGHEAIRNVRGTTYKVGNVVDVLYVASGGSQDYFKGELGVQLSFALELPGGGMIGFDLPPSEINGVVVETFEGIRAWYQYVSDNL